MKKKESSTAISRRIYYEPLFRVHSLRLIPPAIHIIRPRLLKLLGIFPFRYALYPSTSVLFDHFSTFFTLSR
jgi:hypothetical protein